MSNLGSFDYFGGFVHSGTKPRTDANISGLFIRFVACDADLQVSFNDSNQWMPCGFGRGIRSRDTDGNVVRFNKVSFRIDPSVALPSSQVNFVIVYGDMDYDDNRVAFIPGQYVRTQGATRVVSENYTYTDGLGIGYESVNGLAHQFTINIRNLSATAVLRAGSVSVDVAAGKGFYIGPGENADLPMGVNNIGSPGNLAVKTTVGTPYVVTWFCHQ